MQGEENVPASLRGNLKDLPLAVISESIPSHAHRKRESEAVRECGRGRDRDSKVPGTRDGNLLYGTWYVAVCFLNIFI